MRRFALPFCSFFLVSLLALSPWAATGRAKPQRGPDETSHQGYRIEGIQQKRTGTISWLRVQVVADTDLERTWAALQDIDSWSFLRIFSGITPLERNGNMTLYRMSVSPPWPIRDFDSLIWMATLPEQRLMLWRSNKDDLTESHGRIEVRELPGGTLVNYEMHSPAKGSFPPWMVRIGLYLILPGIAQDFYDRIQGQDE